MQNKILEIIFFLLILTLFIALLFSCINHEMRNHITDDHKKIKTLLDEALLSNDPMMDFKRLLPEIREYSTVDSAWISGLTFYVKYKKSGVVTWTISNGQW